MGGDSSSLSGRFQFPPLSSSTRASGNNGTAASMAMARKIMTCMANNEPREEKRREEKMFPRLTETGETHDEHQGVLC